MKKLIYRSLVIAVVLGALSCSDLEEEPIGLLAPEAFFKSTADVETSVLGAYAYIASEQFYGRKLVLSLQLRSDMCDIGDRNTPGRRQQVNDFSMDSNNGMITSFWPRAYQIIGAANAGIEGARIVAEQEGASNPELEALKAEAVFIRAFVYYHLVRVFGEIPYIDFFISNPEEIKDISKSSVQDIYANIISDLEFAKANLPDKHTGDIRSRPTKGSAAAYMASVYLTNEDYTNAYKEAKYVIDSKGTFGYDLMADFAELYNGYVADGLAEHIFMIDFLGQVTGSNSQNTDWMGPITGIRSVSLPNTDAGWSVSVPAFPVFDTWNDSDYRRKVSFIDSAFIDGEKVGYDQFAPNHGSPRPHQGKYFRVAGNHRGDSGQSDNNYSAMRYAEILLIAAEALNMINSGPNAESEGYVNQIRARARNWNGTQSTYPPDVSTGLSQGEFMDVVIEERRLELAFEYKRWYDIVRLGIGDEVFKGSNSLEVHTNFDSSRDYLFPIPQDEIDRNENLKPQNSGY